jgi:hypothetical protein
MPRDRRIPKFLEAEHHSNALLLHTPMVLLDQVVQVFRRASLVFAGSQPSAFSSRTARCDAA